MRKNFSFFLSIFLLVVGLGVSDAHEVIEVKDGATIKGVVTFTGRVPDEETVEIDRDTEVCGKKKKMEKYVISDSKVKNVVLWIEGVEKGKAIPKKDVEILIKNCQVDHLVSAGFVGGRYILKNEDDIFHTLQLKLGLRYQKEASQRPLESGATIYNLAFPKRGMEIQKPIKSYHKYTADTGFIHITSNTHTWIRGHIFIFDHPYVAVTDEKGSFIIDDLPTGDYTLKIWHEGLGMQERKVKVGSGETKEMEIEFQKEGSQANPGGEPAIKFSETRYKFGNAKKGEIIRHDFEFVNEGDGLLRIMDLIPA